MTYIVGQNVCAAVIGFDLFNIGNKNPLLIVREDENGYFKSYWIKFGNQISVVVNFNGRTVGVGAKRFEGQIPLIIDEFERSNDKVHPIQVAVLHQFDDGESKSGNIVEFRRR